MASLFVIQGRDQGRRVDLQRPVVSLGREGSNTIQLHDSEVSRNHAEVRRRDNEFLLVDLESSNGTFVNSEAITEHVLQSGERVQIGRTLMIFTHAEDSSSIDLAEDVDIVGIDRAAQGSRIVKSISHQEGSQFLHGVVGSGVDESESPWLARARSNLQIMYRTALAVSHTLDIDQLLQRILELIFEWVETDRGCIMLVDQESDELLPKVSRFGSHVRDKQRERMEISRTILAYVMEHKEGVLTSDASDDQRWDPAASIVKMGVREAICVPMQGRYGIVGVIYIDTYTPPGRSIQRTPNRFTEEHLKLMVAIAHQAALAVEDTSYYSAMVQAERLAAMGQTIATLSHHVKNILQGIRGGSYLIDHGLNSNDQDVVRQGWSIVEKNQEKISNLVMDMLSFSKEREPDLAPAEWNNVVADVIELMQTRAQETGVELAWEPAQGIPELLFDSEMMHRAILNVVTNAIDACGKSEDGRVVVATEHSVENMLVRVTVADNGEGIPEKDISKIFSVFESRKGNRGTGLGLPVSKKILREHGGDIVVASQVGEGSCFTLEMPAIVPDPGSHGDTRSDLVH
ncbi:MAG: ATP-binding protein [Pirellulaceae bacterium]|jgi:signal transduction histidine kinase|nr:ATP-binding protein [Pirellulaceae bacterium]